MYVQLRGIAIRMLAVSAFTLVLSTHSVSAQSVVGVRAGVSAEPEQFYFGVHAKISEVANKLWFRPNAEVGVGNGLTVTTLNGEFAYYPTVVGKWKPYFGGGPGVVIATVRGGGGSNTDIGPGFNFVLGVEQARGLMVEIKGGALDSPGFKFGIGWNFR